MTYQEQIDEIMDNFDFDRVHRAMVALEWVWTGCNGRTPDKGTLRCEARRLLRQAAKSEYAATGGLCAENIDGYLRLSFEVDDWKVEPRASDRE